jgi:hypothetical protein
VLRPKAVRHTVIGLTVVNKLYSVAVGFFVAVLISSVVRADGPDISAQRLLESWKGDDPGMRMVAEVIASAFASGYSWGGRHAYCASPDIKGPPDHERLRGVSEGQSNAGRSALWSSDGWDAQQGLSVRRATFKTTMIKTA